MPTPPFKYDDSVSGYVRPVQENRTVTAYPFLQNGDVASCIYGRNLVQRQSSYVPLAVGTEKDNVWEGGDPNAYNMPDGAIEPVGIGDLVRFQRNYARIPATQITYPGSRYFPLPTVSNDFGLDSTIPVLSYPLLTSVGNGSVSLAAGGIYTDYQQALYAPLKTCGTKTPGYATAGTFTLTFSASTTGALNWNDSGATIAAAINGLAAVTSAGLTCTVSNALNTVTGGDLIITWTVGSTLTPVTMNAASLTVTTSKNPTTQISSLTQQDILLPDHITITSHGLNTAVALAAVKTSGDQIIVISAGYWGSIDANTIWTPSFGTVNPAAYVAAFKQSYVPGKIYLLRTRVTERFYLPGVTSGITTPSDIPVVLGLQNPADFVLALATLTGWQTYETAGPEFWNGGPMYVVRYTDLNLDDIA